MCSLFYLNAPATTLQWLVSIACCRCMNPIQNNFNSQCHVFTSILITTVCYTAQTEDCKCVDLPNGERICDPIDCKLVKKMHLQIILMLACR